MKFMVAANSLLLSLTCLWWRAIVDLISFTVSSFDFILENDNKNKTKTQKNPKLTLNHK